MQNMHSHSKGPRYLSLNVKGLNSPIKRKKVLSYLKSKHCDIGFLQETHLLDNETKKNYVGAGLDMCL